MEEIRVLELFSGIGGMHQALKYSKIPSKVVAAVDINPIANEVYQHNNPEITILNNNIQKLTASTINKMNINAILMSPPCQPFTRVGLKKDVDDSRTDALKHICKIMCDLTSVDYILMENVKGFENSIARDVYINTLENSGFNYREFILSPSQFGVPNTRHRYYCLARRKHNFNFDGNQIWEIIPGYNYSKIECTKVKSVLESNEDILNNYLLKDNLLEKRAWLLDIATPDSVNTICFTKAYTHYSEGTGSVFSTVSSKEIKEIFNEAKNLSKDTKEYINVLRKAKLRYFTPREVARLMCFPEDFTFPPQTTDKQKYRLLGNSINVLVVAELIKVLIT